MPLNNTHSAARLIHSTELIVGGQKSGKSNLAERRVRQWLDRLDSHSALLIATATIFDDEMQARVDRHVATRAKNIPTLNTIEEPLHLGEMINCYSSAQQLVVVDCLTVWLTNLLMPHPELRAAQQADPQDEISAFFQAIKQAKGPVVLVSNEIGLGVIPMGRETRQFVDELGRLNQMAAALCEAVTLMVAGIPLEIKRPA